MIDLVLLGSGNVATHLFKAFAGSEKIRIKQIYNHSEESLSYFRKNCAVTTDLSKIKEADVYLIALKDDVIAGAAEELRNKDALVAHTSGSAGLNVLNFCKRRGVFYPLQTFSKHKDVNYQTIPFCLEANSSEDMKLLKEMADEISGVSHEISSEQRKKIHLSAVFVCNFVNHLYTIGEKISKENDIPFEIFEPLIKETARKIETASPAGVQTGPAIRRDQETINSHLDQLTTFEEKQIYKLLTNAIQNFHGKKL